MAAETIAPSELSAPRAIGESRELVSESYREITGELPYLKIRSASSGCLSRMATASLKTSRACFMAVAAQYTRPLSSPSAIRCSSARPAHRPVLPFFFATSRYTRRKRRLPSSLFQP